MAGTEQLQKKWKSNRATQKLSGAMKTVSAVKFSQLNALARTYSRYAEGYRQLGTSAALEFPNPDAPVCRIVMGSERGLCGGFNTAVYAFACETPVSTSEPAESAEKPALLITCGAQMTSLFRDAGREPDYRFSFGIHPSFADVLPLCDLLDSLRQDGQISAVQVIYPHFVNTMTQTPVCSNLCTAPEAEQQEDDILWIPDRETVLDGLGERSLRTAFYGMVLETALGAQAATLLTMRSAYDTATELTESLEKEIQRRRQSAVTSDVLETFSERGENEEKTNGT